MATKKEVAPVCAYAPCQNRTKKSRSRGGPYRMFCSRSCQAKATSRKRRQSLLRYYEEHPGVGKGRGAKHTEEVTSQACFLYALGSSIRAVAQELGVHPGCVQHWLRVRKVPSRSKSQSLRGRVLSVEHIEKIRQMKIGKTLSDECKDKISSALRGIPKSASFVQHVSTSRGGTNNPNYNPDRDAVERARLGRRWLLGYDSWVKSVYFRDGYQCVICRSKCHTSRINAHHLDNYKDYVGKRVDIDNGVTLCETCHKAFHRVFGRRNTTREDFESFCERSK